MTITKLKPRDCVLDEETHKYYLGPRRREHRDGDQRHWGDRCGQAHPLTTQSTLRLPQGHACSPLHGGLGQWRRPAGSRQP